jgi:hypothetical protein
MSQSPLESTLPAPATTDFREAEARAIALAERALRSLGRARDGVSALKQVLEQLCTLAATFERVSFRLGELSVGVGAAAPAERPSGIDFIVDIARRTALAIRELEASMRMSVSASDKLIEQTEDGRRALAELIPAVRELGAAAARAQTSRTHAIEVVVRPSSSSPSRSLTETAEQKIASFLGAIWPTPAGGTGSKN